MRPFSDYPKGGMTILKRMGRTNSRREDGLWLMTQAHQDRCVYCGVSLVDDYYHWLLLNVAHVIPAKECERLGIPDDWHHSFTNAVLACSGCNMFDNRYTIEWQQPKAVEAWTVPEFISLRDKVFTDRKGRILDRRSKELQFFDQRIKQ